jgi:hypothetical protein
MISASLSGANASRLTPAALAASAYILRRWWTDWERLAGFRGGSMTTSSMDLMRELYGLNVPKVWVPVMYDLRIKNKASLPTFTA